MKASNLCKIQLMSEFCMKINKKRYLFFLSSIMQISQINSIIHHYLWIITISGKIQLMPEVRPNIYEHIKDRQRVLSSGL